MNEKYDISKDILDLIYCNILQFNLFKYGSLWRIRNFEYSGNEDNIFEISYTFHEENRKSAFHDIKYFSFDHYRLSEMNIYSIFHKLGWDDIYLINFSNEAEEKFYLCSQNIIPFKVLFRDNLIDQVLS